MSTTDFSTSTSDATGSSDAPARKRRGFAAMDPAKQKAIASMGGKAAHVSGHAHEFTKEEARAAGRKRHEKRRELPQ